MCTDQINFLLPFPVGALNVGIRRWRKGRKQDCWEGGEDCERPEADVPKGKNETFEEGITRAAGTHTRLQDKGETSSHTDKSMRFRHADLCCGTVLYWLCQCTMCPAQRTEGGGAAPSRNGQGWKDTQGEGEPQNVVENKSLFFTMIMTH